jgi:tetratricopeptide (TPR) repeat protein/energy-coupling factor transporter ATP-binding protein EcfA2
MLQPTPANPFPGLRPFEADEEHLFFGREREIDELLRRLRVHRFLAVVGTSGCGKSSLIRSGLLPALQSGQMVMAGSSWRVAVFRPGEDPIRRMAGTLGDPDVLGAPAHEMTATAHVLFDATLRRGSLGLVDAVRQARLGTDENVLVLVDQFEELFRFRDVRPAGAADEAVAFVKLLLEAAEQQTLPIYVVITMRSDFIGECMEYPGLPEALNDSQYLVPRMSRDELRSAITGPVAVAGAEIAPRLVMRLLNDLGESQDELPVLQHALMRTWNRWASEGGGRPLDIEDYEAIGTLRQGLSEHAEEALREAGPGPALVATARMFKALTDTYRDPRGIRRPTSVADLAAIAGVPVAEIMRLVEVFRQPGRSFLMPPPDVPLTPETVVDISHESLMRRWQRLVDWSAEERASAEFYVRLAREARWHERGEAALWGDPEVELGERWRRDAQPTPEWAQRYDEHFYRALHFLDDSLKERERQRAERRAHRIRRLIYAWGTAAVLAVLAIWAWYSAWTARSERKRAEDNLGLARAAVDDTLILTTTDPAAMGADVPQMRELRRDLLEKARPFYEKFIEQAPDNDDLKYQRAIALDRLGYIHRALEQRAESEKVYRVSIAELESLAATSPASADYKRALGNAYNGLGETLRDQSTRTGDAERAYEMALRLQSELFVSPGTPAVQMELARTHYNRGILFAQSSTGPADVAVRKAEDDFLRAIRLLIPLAADAGNAQAAQAAQDLGRARNNLGNLLAQFGRANEARGPYEAAITGHQRLVVAHPENREYKLELAQFSNNLAFLLLDQQVLEPAEGSSQRALGLLDDLARPAPLLGVERADAHSLRAQILQARGSPAAIAEYENALNDFIDLARTTDAADFLPFHRRFSDLIRTLSSPAQPRTAAFAGLLANALREYVAVGERALAGGQTRTVAIVVERLGRLLPPALPLVSRDDRQALNERWEVLQKKAGEKSQVGRFD